ncbi:MAG: putative mRNA 3-end processing factor [Thermoplasmata archaeon]|jgi:putative mRNA 3-end processing factor|nr:putative mRNA 3-end processing factor [Thermoplasmata archaeon]
MRTHFLGGVDEVGRLGMVVEGRRTTLLFDYGMAPRDPPEYPHPAPDVEALFLSHSHLDHSGMVPLVAGKQGCPIVGTSLTRTMSDLLAYDSMKVARLEGYPQPFRREDIAAMNAQWDERHYGDVRESGEFDVRFHSAGHIPGSTMFELDDGSTRLLFTGDINLIDTHLVAKAEPVRCDVLAIEATYSGREHPDRKQTEEQLLDAVDGVIAQGGKVVMPCFAVGRTQEMMCVLAQQGYDIWVDGMGKAVVQMMLEDNRYLKDRREMQQALEKCNLVKNPAQRERAVKGDVLITTSGMLEGGPALYYLSQLKEDEKSAVFFSGYQVPGSGGRSLLDTGGLDLGKGKHEKVACEIRSFDFSGHAGHSEIVEFAKRCKPEHVVLYHSDDRTMLAAALSEFAKVHTPKALEEIDFG